MNSLVKIIIVVLAFVSFRFGVALFPTEIAKLTKRLDVKVGQRADKNVLHSVVFVRKQANIEQLESALLEASNPKLTTYGQHWSNSRIAQLTANSQATLEIMQFLNHHKVANIRSTIFDDYIIADAPIQLWEEILSAEFFEMQFTLDSRTFVRSLEYSLPDRLVDFVDAVLNTVQIPHYNASVSAPTTFENNMTAQALFGVTTPALLNSVYNIQSNIGSELTRQAVYANINQKFSPSDLTLFQLAFDLPLQGIAKGVGEHVDDNACLISVSECMEANVDVQYITAVAQNVPTTYYYWSGDDVWLDWILSVANLTAPPQVFSISYGSYEFFMSPAYLRAVNVEAIKLGLQGVTILAASGDDGVAGFGARIFGPAFCSYFPMFPASSPYVTAVGGTMVPKYSEHIF